MLRSQLWQQFMSLGTILRYSILATFRASLHWRECCYFGLDAFVYVTDWQENTRMQRLMGNYAKVFHASVHRKNYCTPESIKSEILQGGPGCFQAFQESLDIGRTYVATLEVKHNIFYAFSIAEQCLSNLHTIFVFKRYVTLASLAAH